MDKNKIYQNVSLKKFNSWKAGGNAENFLICSNVEKLSELIRSKKIITPLTFIGLGSNILIRDGGVKGTIIETFGGLNDIRIEKDAIYAEAGVTCSKLSKFAAQYGLSNSAFLSGIPGTIGGALAMNAGCYGSETWDYVQRVLIIKSNGDIAKKQLKKLNITTLQRIFNMVNPRWRPTIANSRKTTASKQKDDFKVGYRKVVGSEKNENFLAAWFKFPQGNVKDSNDEIKKLLLHRKNTQPLNWPTAGSTFRNPKDHFAAKLIEDCGLKGLKKGMAQVSEKHANFIVNLGDATASDIEYLIDYIQKKVKQETKIDLKTEVKIIGDNC